MFSEWSPERFILISIKWWKFMFLNASLQMVWKAFKNLPRASQMVFNKFSKTLQATIQWLQLGSNEKEKLCAPACTRTVFDVRDHVSQKLCICMGPHMFFQWSTERFTLISLKCWKCLLLGANLQMISKRFQKASKCHSNEFQKVFKNLASDNPMIVAGSQRKGKTVRVHARADGFWCSRSCQPT